MRRIDITGRAAGAAAGVPHRAVIDDIGALIRPEPHIVGAVKPSRIGRADERLVAGIVAGKILEAELERQARVLVEVDQLDFMPNFGGGRVGVRRREPEIALEAVERRPGQDRIRESASASLTFWTLTPTAPSSICFSAMTGICGSWRAAAS